MRNHVLYVTNASHREIYGKNETVNQLERLYGIKPGNLPKVHFLESRWRPQSDPDRIIALMKTRELKDSARELLARLFADGNLGRDTLLVVHFRRNHAIAQDVTALLMLVAPLAPRLLLLTDEEDGPQDKLLVSIREGFESDIRSFFWFNDVKDYVLESQWTGSIPIVMG